MDRLSTVKNTEVSDPGRRKFLAGTLALGFSGVANRLFAKDRPEAPPLPTTKEGKQEKLDPWQIDKIEFDEKELSAYPYGTISTPEKILQTPAGVKVFIENDGTLKIETLKHLEDNGWIAKTTKDKPEVVPGSGFFLAGKDYYYFVTNCHVMDGTKELTRDLATWRMDHDIAIASGNLVLRCDGDKEPIPVSKLAPHKVNNANLAGTDVRMMGFGRRLSKVSGQAVPISVKHQGIENWMAMFGFRLRSEDIPDPKILHGMSGTPVESKEGIVGIFHSYTEIEVAGEKEIMALFTGIDELRRAKGVAITEWTQRPGRDDRAKQVLNGGPKFSPPPAPEKP
ncbi:MAG: serine protease [bacterium]|nr:serine protease [bacterium]